MLYKCITSTCIISGCKCQLSSLICHSTPARWLTRPLTHLSIDTPIRWLTYPLTLLSIDSPVHRLACPLTHLSADTPVRWHTCPWTHLSVDSPLHWHTCLLTHLSIDSPVRWHTCWLTCPLTHLCWHTCPLTHLSFDTPVHWLTCPLTHLSIDTPLRWLTCLLTLMKLLFAVCQFVCVLHLFSVVRSCQEPRWYHILSSVLRYVHLMAMTTCRQFVYWTLTLSQPHRSDLLLMNRILHPPW